MMYWGSQYCAGCKYNRDCYMLNSDPYNHKTNNQCIIAQKNFLEKYKEENKEEIK